MIARPLDERAPRLLGIGQRPRPVGREGDFVQDARDVVAQAEEILLAARLGILVVAGGLRVAVRAGPVDRAGGQHDDVQAGLVDRSPDRHGKDDAIGHARVFAEAHEARPVHQEKTEEGGVSRTCSRRHEHDRYG